MVLPSVRIVHPMNPKSNGHERIDPTPFTIDAALYQDLVEMARESHKSVSMLVSELLLQAVHQHQHGETVQQLWYKLTRREQEIIALYCLGYTSVEIGKRFTLSANTIKSHVHNAMQKFGVSSRSELRGKLSDWDFARWLGIEPEDLPGYSQSYLPLPGMDDPRNRRVE
jgi:DNA-binding CsgD family transcriptional regulator